jgi:ubiquinone/menaquinone biosynthesis C-methylase UbiE
MPGRELSDDDVDVLIHGHIAFQMLYSAYQLGLFNYLSTHPGATPHQTATAVGLTDYPFAVLLGGLRTLGLITEDSGSLRNALATEKLLVTGSADNRTALLRMHHDLVYPGVGDFLDALRQATNVGLRHFSGTGDTLYARLATQPRLERVLHDGLKALSDVAFSALIKCEVLATSKHLLDIGGGGGSNALALAEAYQYLTITVVDLPSVLDIAAANVAQSSLADRIKLHACDFLTDPLPSGADTVLFAHVFPIFSPEINRGLLAKAHNALPVGGRVLIFNTMQDDTQDGPIMAMLFSAYFLSLASGHGRYYPWEQHERWLQETGFTVQRYGDMPYSHGLCVGTKR